MALAFVDCINHRDLAGITALVNDDHRFVDLAGNEERGRDAMRSSWQDYFTTWPDYHIYLEQVVVVDNTVVLTGRTTGSHLNMPDADEFLNDTLIWVAEIADNRVAEWRLYHDTPDNRKLLRVRRGRAVFEAEQLTATIRAHLRLLPDDANTPTIRKVRRRYSRLLKKAPAELVVEVARDLLRTRQHRYRFVAYELVFHHEAALASLDAEMVRLFGAGIDHWSSVDIFAHYIAGPAWKNEQVPDAVFLKWAQSDDKYWRRAALVSTIYLYGDSSRMLQFCRLLVDDHDDLIVKAVSWVLREAVQYNRLGVEQFLSDYDMVLAARVKREVRNKIRAGLKSPRRGK